MKGVAPNRVARVVGYKGDIPSPVYEVLEHVWAGALGLDADYARQHRTHVAFAASMGWISTIRPDGLSYGRAWYITAAGLHVLEDYHNTAT